MEAVQENAKVDVEEPPIVTGKTEWTIVIQAEPPEQIRLYGRRLSQIW